MNNYCHSDVYETINVYMKNNFRRSWSLYSSQFDKSIVLRKNAIIVSKIYQVYNSYLIR